MMMTKKSNNNGRIPKLEKELKNRIVGHEMVQLDQLLAHPNNWRRHPKYQQDALAGLIDDIGFIRSVLVNKTTGTVIDGHLRVALASRSGVQELPVEYIELTEEQEIKALALLDPIAAMADTDRSKLAEILSMIDAQEERIRSALHYVAKKNQLKYDSNDNDPSPLIEIADQLQIKWRTKLGQMWTLGKHRILCGDCTDPNDVNSLLQGDLVDQLLTDPPYGVDYAGKDEYFESMGGGMSVKKGYKNDTLSDYATFFYNFLKPIPFADYNTVYICMSDIRLLELSLAMDKAGIHRSQSIIWVKNTLVPGRQDYYSKHEVIIYGWKNRHRFYAGVSNTVIDDDVDPSKLNKDELVEIVRGITENRSTIIRINKPSASIYHPTTKPMPLFERLMRDGSDTGAIVYDAFLGSGTTLLAAEMNNRQCRGMEIDPGYIAVTLERWQKMTSQEPKLNGLDV